ncbi:MAG TPA: hypothetical protein VNK94_04690 [Gaiellaceae bacterium]|nr:hypothetical protein [Gaiellaceae bacterium]
MPEDFLPERDERTWRLDSPPRGLTPECWWRGRGDSFRAEVALARATARPRAQALRELWRTRSDGSQPVLLVLTYPDGGSSRALACGPVGEQPPIRELELEHAARLAAAVLDEPDGHAALRLLHESLGELEEALPGVRNDGLLALHDLMDGVPTRRDWAEACERARPLLARAGRDLVSALGFRTETADALSVELLVDERRRALAVFLDEREDFDRSEPRFGGLSPVSHALNVAQRRGLPWVVLTRGRQIRLYSVDPNVGVGRRGRALTSFGLDLALLPTDRAGYLDLVFSPRALDQGGTLEELLESSARFAADLGARLRDRLYDEAVPTLATAVARRLTEGREPSEQDLADAYEQTLTILFRLLFVAYGEDRALLPYDANQLYRERSLKRLAVDLAERGAAGELDFDPVQTDLWTRVRDLWRAIELGHTEWGVPRYGGSLFSSDPEISPPGAGIAQLELTNAELGPALAATLVDLTPEGTPGPVDFRSLSVREFGTIYEGLLESELSVAPTDLTLDRKGTYVPARPGDQPAVRAGEIYFHDRSGARKATGSYFTKPFAVEHLLDRALVPALEDHLARIEALLDAGEEAAAAAAFFDFRCADLAMGSAHFLVAAVDRIEARFSGFLAEHRIPGVERELEQLRSAARAALGPLADSVEIETSSLLRRLVARRCIYGVDLNLIAVELARLALWIHTFVPGLPLSFLDRNLVQGNSLTGVATLDEAIDALDPTHGEQLSVLRDPLLAFLGRAEPHLRRLATIADATSADVEEARAAAAAAEAELAPLRAALDLVVAHRLGRATLPPGSLTEEALLEHEDAASAAELARELQVLHFPVAFPEVFLRERPGFDCLLGNPPWQEATIEELGFWALRFPGLKSLPQGEQRREIERLRSERPDLVEELGREQALQASLRKVLTSGAFPGMGTGDPDLYKAFAWRFWRLCREGGVIGIVLPQGPFVAAGSAPWRNAVFPASFVEIDMCKNVREWLFTDVNPGWPVNLVGIQKYPAGRAGELSIAGVFTSRAEFEAGVGKRGVLSVAKLKPIDDLLCLPALGSTDDVRVFGRLIVHPTLGDRGRSDFRARPHTDFHATNDRAFMSGGPDPVYNHLNIGHFRFEPDAGRFASTDLAVALDELERRRQRGARNRKSPFSEMPAAWFSDPDQLPARQPRIAFRDVVHSSNRRKMWAALVPPGTVLTNAAPYLLFPRGGVLCQAYLLALLGSSVVDYFVHARIHLHVNYFILNSIPIPPFIAGDARCERLAVLAATLACGHWDQRVGGWSDLVVRDLDLRDAVSELDAIASLLYGLADDDLDVIWDGVNETRPDASAVRVWRSSWQSRD